MNNDFRLLIFCAIVLSLIFQSQCLKELDICVVPHSHLDLGWKRTFEGYYSSVERIIKATILSLLQEPSRKFNWAETAYLDFFLVNNANRRIDSDGSFLGTKLLSELNNTKKSPKTWIEVLEYLIERKQWEFIGGGWAQHDEALSSPQAIIDQLTEGHIYLKKTFNITPYYGYQIDPFGHSQLTASLFKLMGFKGVILNRIHWKLKEEYGENIAKLFYWKPQGAFDNETILAHLLYDHYNPFENIFSRDKSFDLKETLVAGLREHSEHYPTNQILFLWFFGVRGGDDFRFINADKRYSMMDDFISYINGNKDLKMKIRYCLLSEYFESVAKQNLDLPIIDRDFFPYSDKFINLWSGFYSSRPSLKKLAREADSILRQAEFFHAFSASIAESMGDENDIKYPLLIKLNQQIQQLRSARRLHAIITHHDAITGTCAQEVCEDYTLKLLRMIQTSENVLAAQLPVLMENYESFSFTVAIRDHSIHGSRGFSLPFLPQKIIHPIVLMNSLGFDRKEYITLFSDSPIVVFDENENPVIIQVEKESQYRTTFLASCPSLGYSTYFIERVEEQTISQVVNKLSSVQENTEIKANIKKTLQKITNKKQGISLGVHQSFVEYLTTVSGAYIFLPRVWQWFWIEFSRSFGITTLIISIIKIFFPFYMRILRFRYSRSHLITSTISGFLYGMILFTALSTTRIGGIKPSEKTRMTTEQYIGSQLGILQGLSTVWIPLFFASISSVPGFYFAWLIFPSYHAGFFYSFLCNLLVTMDSLPYSLSKTVEGQLFQDSTQRISEHVIQSIKVFKEVEDFYNFVEINVDTLASRNTELCMRFDLSSFSRKFQLSTDNGLNHVTRSHYKAFEFLPGNGYPTISQITLSDEDRELIILSSQSIGVINVGDSYIDLMLHRNLTQDDGKGLDEWMEDDVSCTYTFWIFVGKKMESNFVLKQKLRLNHPLHLLVPSGDWKMNEEWKLKSKLSRSFGSSNSYHILSWKVKDDLPNLPHEEKEEFHRFKYILRTINQSKNTVESLMRDWKLKCESTGLTLGPGDQEIHNNSVGEYQLSTFLCEMSIK